MKSASGRYKVVRQDLKPQKEIQTSSSSSSEFNGILSTFKKPSTQSEPKTMKGLTVADYRSHPATSPYSPPARRLPANTEGPASSAYKEASEYLLGSESPKIQISLSPEAGVDDRSQNTSPSGLNYSLNALSPPSGRGASQIRTSATSQKIEKAIQDAAAQYQISPKLIKGVVKAESNYDANAVSPAGAQGLMQLMPGTARDLGVTNPFDIKQNIDGGVRYLKKMMDMFGGNIRKALSAYNAGPETVKRYNGDVPYSETRQYVDRVIDNTKTAV
ncbi:MAG: lytic transglycosylase domain-containing protein [Pseudomonadota bacterium]